MRLCFVERWNTQEREDVVIGKRLLAVFKGNVLKVLIHFLIISQL